MTIQMCPFPLAMLVHRQLAYTSWLELGEMNFPSVTVLCQHVASGSLQPHWGGCCCKVPGAAVCDGMSVRGSALVKLPFFPLPFDCRLPPAQALGLAALKHWGFQGIRGFWLLPAAWHAQHQTRDSGIDCTKDGAKDAAPRHKRR